MWLNALPVHRLQCGVEAVAVGRTRRQAEVLRTNAQQFVVTVVAFAPLNANHRTAADVHQPRTCYPQRDGGREYWRGLRIRRQTIGRMLIIARGFAVSNQRAILHNADFIGRGERFRLIVRRRE